MKNQGRFREKCSTNDCLISLETNIQEAFQNKQHLMSICLDMEKAYDLIWRRRILHLLTKYKITGNIFHFIKNFLNNISIQVKISNHYSKSYNIANGVPQGSLISVTLFLLAINDIQEHITPPIASTIFADDVTLFMKSKNLKSAQNIIQNTLNNLVNYANKSGFKFSVNKTLAIIFTRNKKIKHKLSLYIGNNRINIVQETKILGLTFDAKLTWKHHIDNLKDQCSRRLNILKILSAMNWGANQKTLCSTYKAII